MTKDRNDKTQNRTDEMDEEACRRLMILLCGSKEEADAMADALMRYATPEQEQIIKKHYELSRQNAQQAGQYSDIALHPRLADRHFDESASPSLTEAEEKEFDSFMQEVYRRAEARTTQDPRGVENAGVVPLLRDAAAAGVTKATEISNSAARMIEKYIEKLNPFLDRLQSCRRRLMTVKYLRLNRLTTALGPEDPDPLGALNVAQGEITFWDDGARVYVTFSANASPIGIELGIERRTYKLKPSQEHPDFFEIEDFTSGEGEEFVMLHIREPGKFPIRWW